jgi:hypothetical protein
MKNSYVRKKMQKWLVENFGDSSSNALAGNTSGMSSNANHTFTGGSLPFAGNLKQDIAGEDLKQPSGGVTKLKELKDQVNRYISDIKATCIDCLSREASVDSYTKILDVIQKPEVLSAIEHLKQELNKKQQTTGLQ